MEQAVLTELQAIAAGRADLLAHRPGLALGYDESQLDADHYQRITELLIKAGADESLIPGWAQVARERAAAATRDRRPGQSHVCSPFTC